MLGGEADHGEVDGLRQLLDGAVAPHAPDRFAAAVDRVCSSLEVRRKDVAEQLPADRASPPRSADHDERPRREERPQRSGDRQVVSLVHARPERFGGGDREAHFDLTAVQLAGDLEAGVLEDA